MKKIIFFFLLTSIGCASSNPQKTPSQESQSLATMPPLPTTLDEAVQSDFRKPEFKARDVYRHPVQTLNFFGLKPDMTVVEVSPGAGWYTQILVPYLAAKGHYIMAAPSSNEHGKDIEAWMSAHPQIAESVTKTTFEPPASVQIAPEGSADMVLTFRNVHNWMEDHAEQAAFNAFFKALKSGGILGVVEHRAPAYKKMKADSGYVKQKDVIRFAAKAGFRLVAKSEINANPKDKKNYPNGVWALPPVNKHDPSENQKYSEIGESDRMTLKFIKP